MYVQPTDPDGYGTIVANHHTLTISEVSEPLVQISGFTGQPGRTDKIYASFERVNGNFELKITAANSQLNPAWETGTRTYLAPVYYQAWKDNLGVDSPPQTFMKRPEDGAIVMTMDGGTNNGEVWDGAHRKWTYLVLSTTTAGVYSKAYSPALGTVWTKAGK